MTSDRGESKREAASAILAAGSSLVTPTSEGAAQKAARRIVRAFDHPLSERLLDIGDAETCARYILSLVTPSKDVVEGARTLSSDFCQELGTSYPRFKDMKRLAERIATFATAHAAREREAVVALIQSRAMRNNKLGLLDGSFIALTDDVADQLIAAIRARTP